MTTPCSRQAEIDAITRKLDEIHQAICGDLISPGCRSQQAETARQVNELVNMTTQVRYTLYGNGEPTKSLVSQVAANTAARQQANASLMRVVWIAVTVSITALAGTAWQWILRKG